MTQEAILYLHGLPGSFASEMEIVFGAYTETSRMIGLDRLGTLGQGEDYDTAILAAFDKAADALHGEGALRLVAFSLGAMAALRIAAFRHERIASLDLIAPAAPLQLGDFLADMAGKPVFQAAQKGAPWLGLFTLVQSAGLRLAPGMVASQLFAGAPDTERRLMTSPERRKAFIAGMRHALHLHTAAYKAELRAYVSDWSRFLPEVRTPVRVWQGSADTWAPPAMAQALYDALRGPKDLVQLEGLSHYGALVHSLPKIRSAPFEQDTPIRRRPRPGDAPSAHLIDGNRY